MLCKVCQNINFDEAPGYISLIYRHHVDSAALKASADEGCKLCRIIFNIPRASFRSDPCPRITLTYRHDKKAPDFPREDFQPSDSNEHTLELPMAVGIEYGLWGGIGSVNDVLDIVELPGEQPSLLRNSRSLLMTGLCRLSHGGHERFYSRKQPAHR